MNFELVHKYKTSVGMPITDPSSQKPGWVTRGFSDTTLVLRPHERGDLAFHARVSIGRARADADEEDILASFTWRDSITVMAASLHIVVNGIPQRASAWRNIRTLVYWVKPGTAAIVREGVTLEMPEAMQITQAVYGRKAPPAAFVDWWRENLQEFDDMIENGLTSQTVKAGSS